MRRLAENDVSEFEYERAGVRVRIVRGNSLVHRAELSPALNNSHRPSPALAGKRESPLLESAPQRETAAEQELHIVCSPIVGTFYRAPSPDAPPYVSVGDKVHEGTILCIIEAMKLMNEIRSEVAGEVLEVFVANGQPVEYGQQLFAIRLDKAK